MTCVCSICKDNLTRRPDTLPQNANFVILAMECGHVFHQVCIKRWFAAQFTQKSQGLCPVCDKGVTIQQARRVFLQEDEETPKPQPQVRVRVEQVGYGAATPIPSSFYMNCRPSSSSSSGNSRPTSAKNYNDYGASNHSDWYEDDYNSDEDYVNLGVGHGIDGNDDAEMGHVTAILEETGTELEIVRAQHEELKFKYVCLTSELDKFQHDLRDCTFMDNVYRVNWQVNVDHVSKQKDDAFKKLDDLEARIRRLEINDKPTEKATKQQ